MAQPNPSLAVPFNTSALDSDSDWDHANGIQRFVSHQQIHSMEDSLEFEDLDGGFLFSASEEDDEHLSQHDDMEEEEQIDGGGGAFDGDASERETEDAFRNLHPQPHFHNRRSFHQRHHANRASLTPILLCDSTISLPSSDEVIIVSSSLPPRANDNVTSQSSTLQARNQQTDEQGANHTIRPTRRVIQRLSSHDLNQDPDTSVEFVSQSFAVFDTPERLERIGRTSQHHNEFTLYSELQRQRQRQLRSLHEASGSGSISSSSASSSSSANRFGTLIPSHVQGHGEPQLANSPDTEPEDDSDLTLARRLQEEEYQVLQSSNVEENVQRLFGILQDGDEEGPQPLIPSDDDSSEDGTIQNVFTSALSEYRESQRARHLESHLDAAEARVASTRRSRRRALPASDDDDDDEWALRALMGASGDGGAGVSVRSSRGRPARGRRGRGARSDGEDQLVRMEFGALFGAGGHERPWLPPVGGRGLMNGVMAGLIPELFGAGAAFNPGNYVDDDSFDTSYESLMALSERIGAAKPKGLDQRVIDSLPTKAYKLAKESATSSKGKEPALPPPIEDEDAKCAICLTEFEAGEAVSGLPCLHWFHGVCIKTWLKDSKVCPICRTDVT